MIPIIAEYNDSKVTITHFQHSIPIPTHKWCMTNAHDVSCPVLRIKMTTGCKFNGMPRFKCVRKMWSDLNRTTTSQNFRHGYIGLDWEWGWFTFGRGHCRGPGIGNLFLDGWGAGQIIIASFTFMVICLLIVHTYTLTKCSGAK